MNRYNIFGAVFFAAVYLACLIAYVLDRRDDERERKEDE